MKLLTDSHPKSSDAMDIYEILDRKIYELIVLAFNWDKKVILSFDNFGKLTWSLVTKAMGQLYDNFSDEKIG